MIRVLFLCLGNICRSPMAEAVFRSMLEESGLDKHIEADSAGLGGWHVGEPPHQGTIDVLMKHSIRYDGIRSRQIGKSDLTDFDYIAAMDEDNVKGLSKLGTVGKTKVFRLLDLVEDSAVKDVPDPYYTGNFDEVYQLVAKGCATLLQKIVAEHQLANGQ
ncbi:low molecular weight phosphotyrosine protein phosphatase [Alicyclobacillus tolerans]|uniref:low molecular weight protein-tyrosine-phosphatase n=1 Tax=Alicyclobacillus tolerans TaxID=90970 RepID=UPI001F1BBD3D|nr:low molecular weight protein-tyrosine-phosphatase [Alicyclobacillus tolerans]MCF8564925.1 low molecular weight phosphotyrosine protein phosphatase [Alicyclobacillus tolerans]